MKKPILFLNFNRPQCTLQSFERIRQYRPKKLYIAVDGPRTDRLKLDLEQIRAVKKAVAKIDWECDVRRWYSPKNMGCKKSIQSSLDRFFDQEEEGIILEDDCVPSAGFFKFMEDLLEKYRFDERIAVVHGNSVGYESRKGQIGESYFFTQFMNMWGWGTWRRTHQLIDKEMAIWKAFDNKHHFLERLLESYGSKKDGRWVDYWKNQFSRVAENRVDTWDFQWIFNILEKKMFCIAPATNLVENIGWGTGATHTHATDLSICNVPAGKMRFPLKHPKTDRLKINSAYEAHIKAEWCGIR